MNANSYLKTWFVGNKYTGLDELLKNDLNSIFDKDDIYSCYGAIAEYGGFSKLTISYNNDSEILAVKNSLNSVGEKIADAFCKIQKDNMYWSDDDLEITNDEIENITKTAFQALGKPDYCENGIMYWN